MTLTVHTMNLAVHTIAINVHTIALNVHIIALNVHATSQGEQGWYGGACWYEDFRLQGLFIH
eukprot:6534358-Pyramimonas_sp.AAC.1